MDGSTPQMKVSRFEGLQRKSTLFSNPLKILHALLLRLFHYMKKKMQLLKIFFSTFHPQLYKTCHFNLVYKC